MRIIITGNGRSGSWAIRGQQLAEAIGAEAAPKAIRFIGADIVVGVKRIDPALYRQINGARLVWDVVDAWPQQGGINDWSRGQCMAWLEGQIAAIRPHAIVAATLKMADDVREVFSGPVLALPHHARPHQVLNPICHTVCNVGYEGGTQYLGQWACDLMAECKRRRWAFTPSPVRLAHLDIVVAVRAHQGYASRNWKSGVKLANAQATGTPFVGNREAGYLETSCGVERWADDMDQMREAFDELEDQRTRQAVHEKLLAARPSIEDVAATYRAWLETLA